MALNIQQGVITSPGSTGIVTYSLPSNFDPTAIIVWTTGANGQSATSALMSVGFGSYRGFYEQCYISFFALDAATAEDSARGMNTTAILKGYSTGTPTIDFVVTLNALTIGASSDFRLNWTDLPAAAIEVHYIVFGGTALTGTGARVQSSSITWNTTPGDAAVALGSGAGQPDLVLFCGGGNQTGVGDGTGGSGDNGIYLGAGCDNIFGTAGVQQRCGMLMTQDGAANMTMGGWQKSALVLKATSTMTADAEIGLDVRADWPVDGFGVTKPDVPAGTFVGIFMAIKFATGHQIESTIGNTTVPTAVAPQTTTLTGSYPPKLVMFWGVNKAAGTTIDTTHADLGQFLIAGSDGANPPGCAWWSNDDGNAAAWTNRGSHTDKVMRWIVQPTSATALGATASTATVSFSGNNVVLNWDDTDTVAREYNYLIIREAAATALERVHGAQVGENFVGTGQVNYGAGPT